MKRSKAYQNAAEKIDHEQLYSPARRWSSPRRPR